MSEQPSDAKNFALFIEMACDEFGLLNSLIKGKIQIVPSDPRNLRAAGSIQMVLARSFIFDVARAYRICKHGRFLQNHPNERRSFLGYLEKIELVDIRDVRTSTDSKLDIQRGEDVSAKLRLSVRTNWTGCGSESTKPAWSFGATRY
jgi:hypothetical protein